MTRKRVSENQLSVSSAAAVPARRKSASPKRVARPSTVEVPSTPTSTPEVPSVTPATIVAMSADAYHAAVASLAHSYWEARGYVGGSSEEDWFRAEQELSATLTK